MPSSLSSCKIILISLDVTLAIYRDSSGASRSEDAERERERTSIAVPAEQLGTEAREFPSSVYFNPGDHLLSSAIASCCPKQQTSSFNFYKQLERSSLPSSGEARRDTSHMTLSRLIKRSPAFTLCIQLPRFRVLVFPTYFQTHTLQTLEASSFEKPPKILTLVLQGLLK
ncbi:hypothetical protein B0H34DRAFT_334401 [Crassisporium funariophilum]|nr:hypothetical protein B0H34DRAFT_334401 [Crassisporium funariophilum]